MERGAWCVERGAWSVERGARSDSAERGVVLRSKLAATRSIGKKVFLRQLLRRAMVDELSHDSVPELSLIHI